MSSEGHSSQSDVSIVHPVKTSSDGHFISHSLSHHFESGRVKRELRPLSPEGHVYYQVSHNERTLTFNLSRNTHLVSGEYILERRGGNGTEHHHPDRNSCHLLGTVEASGVRGTAAISTCKGLVRGYSIVLFHPTFAPGTQLSLKKCITLQLTCDSASSELLLCVSLTS